MAFFDDLGKKTRQFTDVARLNSMISDEEKKANGFYYQLGKLYMARHAADYEPDFEALVNAIKETEMKVVEYRQQIQAAKGIVRCEKCGAENSNTVAFCSTCGAQMPRNPMDTRALDDCVKCGYCGSMVKKLKFCTICGRPLNLQPAAPASPAYAPAAPASPAYAPVAPAAPAYAPAAPAYAPEAPAATAYAPEAPAAPAYAPEAPAAPAPEAPAAPAPEAPQKQFCTGCGAPLDPDSAFCTNCGTPVEAAPTAEAPAAAAKICPVCGAELDPDMLFCTECGAKIG